MVHARTRKKHTKTKKILFSCLFTNYFYFISKKKREKKKKKERRKKTTHYKQSFSSTFLLFTFCSVSWFGNAVPVSTHIGIFHHLIFYLLYLLSFPILPFHPLRCLTLLFIICFTNFTPIRRQHGPT